MQAHAASLAPLQPPAGDSETRTQNSLKKDPFDAENPDRKGFVETRVPAFHKLLGQPIGQQALFRVRPKIT